MRDWWRNDIMGVAGLLVAVVACLATLIGVPEVRNWLGLPPATSTAATPTDQHSSPPADTEPAIGPTVAAPKRIAVSDRIEALEPQPATVRQGVSGVRAEAKDDWGAQEELAKTAAPARERIPDTEEARLEQESRWRAERAQQSREERKATKGLVIFKITPADASLYLDRKLIGSPHELEAGIWIEEGGHSLAIVRPGFKSREVTLTVESGEVLNVRLGLQEAETFSQSSVQPAE